MKAPFHTREKDEIGDYGTETSAYLLTDRSLEMCLPLGPSFSFVFHLEELYFLECNNSFDKLNPKDEKDWRGKSLFFLFDTLAAPAHLRGARMLFLKGMEFLKKEDVGKLSFQLQFDFKDEKAASRHILLQCCNMGKSPKSNVPLGLGRITDIHHLSMDADPSLTMIRDKHITYSMKAVPDSENEGHSFALTPRELEVLKLKSNGLSTREIALNLRRSPLTVYSVIRDIKKKTGMEIIPLIKTLFENGKLK